MNAQPPIIRLENVHKAFGRVVVLRGVTLDIPRGLTTVVIGPSGSGKSVLLKHMVGLIAPDRGRVLFEGQDITAMAERDLVPIRRRVGFLFQGSALFDSMSVEENICFPLAEASPPVPRAEQTQRCRRALSIVGLDNVQGKFPEALSGGQKKRVALARAIVLEPEVILYDEPTTGLDPVRSDLINELILKLQRELHTTAVVVTHDMASARKVGDRIVMLNGGRIIADAPPDQLERVEDETVQRFVQGRASEDELRELHGGDLNSQKTNGGSGT